MLTVKNQKGFTLVELAIVLTIIGLLIGGILKGQQLMQNSRVTATVAQVNGFEAATTSFRDAYGELPGDMTDAVNRIPGCLEVGTAPNITSGCDLTGGESGNGKVGIVNWDIETFQGYPLEAGTATAPPFDPVMAETVLFWFELQQAGLISSVTDEGVNEVGVSPTFEGTFPGAKVGGGWWVGNISGLDEASPGVPGAAIGTRLGRTANDLPSFGTSLVMIAKPNPGWAFGNASGTDPVPTDEDKAPLIPAVAAQMDRKIDDGLPFTGQVQAYGGQDFDYTVGDETGACTDGTSYVESNISKDCGLILRIQR